MPFEAIGHGTTVTYDGKLNATIDIAGPLEVSADGYLIFRIHILRTFYVRHTYIF
jgi:hypothetical protein